LCFLPQSSQNAFTITRSFVQNSAFIETTKVTFLPLSWAYMAVKIASQNWHKLRENLYISLFPRK